MEGIRSDVVRIRYDRNAYYDKVSEVYGMLSSGNRRLKDREYDLLSVMVELWSEGANLSDNGVIRRRFLERGGKPLCGGALRNMKSVLRKRGFFIDVDGELELNKYLRGAVVGGGLSLKLECMGCGGDGR